MAKRITYVKWNEVYQARQGEGPSTGTPSLFVRLFGCNLACVWCDTPYTWFTNERRFVGEEHFPFAKVNRDDEEHQSMVRHFASLVHIKAQEAELGVIENIIFTGGEPLLQQRVLVPVIDFLTKRNGEYKFEVETNGTVPLSEDMASRLWQVNCSPKLSNSRNIVGLRHRDRALKSIAEHPNSHLKFVFKYDKDIEDIMAVLHIVDGFPHDRVWLMPEGITTETQMGKPLERVTKVADKYGFKVSPRVHIIEHGDMRGT